MPNRIRLLRSFRTNMIIAVNALDKYRTFLFNEIGVVFNQAKLIKYTYESLEWPTLFSKLINMVISCLCHIHTIFYWVFHIKSPLERAVLSTNVDVLVQNSNIGRVFSNGLLLSNTPRNRKMFTSIWKWLILSHIAQTGPFIG